MENSATVAQRVKRLYGTPGFETWQALAEALRLPAAGSAYSLAHGLRKPDARTVKWLEVIEFRPALAQAVENLQKLQAAAPEPVQFSRVYVRRLAAK